MRATRNAAARQKKDGSGEVRAGRSLRPKKRVSYAQGGDSEDESETEQEDEQSADEEDDEAAEVHQCNDSCGSDGDENP